MKMIFCRTRVLTLLLPVIMMSCLTGCAGIAKGVTEAFIGDSDSKQDTRKCYVRGRPIAGLKEVMSSDALSAGDHAPENKTLKILMVHGIGSHQPGYSTRIAESIARKLDLNRVDEETKEIKLKERQDSTKELGILRLNRFNSAGSRNGMIFAELTWDPIVEQEKQTIAFDNSGEYSFRRALINNTLKEFVNGTLPDVLMYNGTSRLSIQFAVGQSMCWLMSQDWNELPASGNHFCDNSGTRGLLRIDDNFVFITHSLGSRITIDALQLIASEVSKRAQSNQDFARIKAQLQEKEFTVFMLSNQLPLLQLGQPEPSVTGKIAEICGPNAVLSEQRMFKKTNLIAFSDPNDLFSYAIPNSFVNEHMDSRICPTITNVILNVAEVLNILGGDLANPLSAHTQYDADERVLSLISSGIGGKNTDAVINERCTWLETVPK